MMGPGTESPSCRLKAVLHWQKLVDCSESPMSPSRSLSSLLSAPSPAVLKPECVCSSFLSSQTVL